MDQSNPGAGSSSGAGSGARRNAQDASLYSSSSLSGPLMAYQREYQREYPNFTPYMYVPGPEAAPYAVTYPYAMYPQPESAAPTPPARTASRQDLATRERSGSQSRPKASHSEPVQAEASSGKATTKATSSKARSTPQAATKDDPAVTKRATPTVGAAAGTPRPAVAAAAAPATMTTRTRARASEAATQPPMTPKTEPDIDSFPTPVSSVGRSPAKSSVASASPSTSKAVVVAGTKRPAPAYGGGPAKKQKIVIDSASKLSEPERRATFAIDPLVEAIESNRIFCKDCQKWVKLGDGVRFRIKHWAGHCALVHKRDRRTAGDLLSKGVEEAAKEARAIEDAKSAAERAVQEAAAKKKARDEAKAAAQAEGRARTAAATKARIAAAAARNQSAAMASGTSTPIGGKSASKQLAKPTAAKPPAPRSGYETRAKGPPVPPRYNYEEEIPEPYDFGDADQPPVILPLRLRRERVGFGSIQPVASPAADIARLMRPGAGVPASGSVKVPRFVSGKEAFQAAERAQEEQEHLKDVWFLEPKRKPGQEIFSRAEILGIKPRSKRDTDLSLDYTDAESVPIRSRSPVVEGLPSQLAFTGSPIEEPMPLPGDLRSGSNASPSHQTPRRISGAALLQQTTPLEFLPLMTTPLKFTRKPGFEPDMSPVAGGGTMKVAAASTFGMPMPAPTITDRNRFAKIVATSGGQGSSGGRRLSATSKATQEEDEDWANLDEEALNALNSRDVRRAELQRDPDVRAIGVDAVQCNGCGKWFKLSIDLYTASRWYGPKGHKRKCAFLQHDTPEGSVERDAGPLEAISMDWSELELRRDPRVREVREGRVQCSACGKWTQQQNWEAHYLFRCRNQPDDQDCALPSPRGVTPALSATGQHVPSSRRSLSVVSASAAVEPEPGEDSMHIDDEDAGAADISLLEDEVIVPREDASPTEVEDLSAATALRQPSEAPQSLRSQSVEQIAASERQTPASSRASSKSRVINLEPIQAAVRSPARPHLSPLSIADDAADQSGVAEENEGYSPLTPTDDDDEIDIAVAVVTQERPAGEASEGDRSRASSVASDQFTERSRRSSRSARTSSQQSQSQLKQIEARRAELEQDPNVAEVSDDSVCCAACGAWVVLGETLYSAQKWDGRKGHKSMCQALQQLAEERESEPRKQRPTQDDFDMPDALKDDPAIRGFDGDFVQCDWCGKWILGEKWQVHKNERCPRGYAGKARQSAVNSSAEEDQEAHDELSSLSSLDGENENGNDMSVDQPPSETSSPRDEFDIEVQTNGPSNPGSPSALAEPGNSPAATSASAPATFEDITSTSSAPLPSVMNEDTAPDEPRAAPSASRSPSPVSLLNAIPAHGAPESLLTDTAQDTAPRSPSITQVEELLPPGPDEEPRAPTPPAKELDIPPSGSGGSLPAQDPSPSVLLQMEPSLAPSRQSDPSQVTLATASPPLEEGGTSSEDIEMADPTPATDTPAIDEVAAQPEDIRNPSIEQPDSSTTPIPHAFNLSSKESATEVVASSETLNSKLDADDHALQPTIPESTATDTDDKMAVDDPVPDTSPAEPDPVIPASPSSATPTPTRVLRERRPPPSPSAAPGVSPEELRRSLAENPNVRSLEGDRLQCNYCGKWLTIPGWESHVSTKCRHRPKKRGTGLSAPKPLPPPKLSDTEKQSGASVLPFNTESELPDGSESRRRNIQVMTEAEKMALAGDFLKKLVSTRIDELKADPDVREIGDGTVMCDHCGIWIKLSNHMYAAHRWFGPQGHKAKCQRRAAALNAAEGSSS